MPSDQANYRYQAKHRVLDAAQHDRDWREVANSHRISLKTTGNWVSLACSSGVWAPPQGKWGKRRYEKLSARHIKHLEQLLKRSCLVPLVEIADSIETEFAVRVGQQTVKNATNGHFYTNKMTHEEPNYMNIPVNKHKHHENLSKLNDYIADGKKIYYVDGTNFNV